MRKAVLGLLFLGFLMTNSLALADATITFACGSAVEDASAFVKVSEANPFGGCAGVGLEDCGEVQCGILSVNATKTFRRTCDTLGGRPACFTFEIRVRSPNPYVCFGVSDAGSVTCPDPATPNARYPKLTVR